MKKTDWGKGVTGLKRTSFVLPEKIWKAIKIRALQEGRNTQELVAEALENYLKSRKEGK